VRKRQPPKGAEGAPPISSMNSTFKVKKYSLYLLLFLFLSALGFQHHTQFYEGSALNYIVADSKLYFELSKSLDGLSGILIISSKNKNLFGPLIYYDFLLLGNRLLFFIMNSLILVHAFACLSKLLDKNQKTTLVMVFIMLNPVLLFSLSGPNKEITGIISMLYFLCFLGRSGFGFLFLALAFAALTRFEMLGYLIITSILLNADWRWRGFILIGILLGLSYLIWFTGYSHVEKVSAGARLGSFGLVKELAVMSSDGLYFIAFLPRLLINLFGNLFAVGSLNLVGNSINIYVSQALFFFLAVQAVFRKAYKIRNDVSFSFIVYCMVFCVPAFIQHRYFVPAYPLLVFMAVAPRAIGHTDCCRQQKSTLMSSSVLQKVNFS